MTPSKNRSLHQGMVLALVLLLAACTPEANPLVGESPTAGDPAGVLLGLWHGFIMLFTFLWSLFSDSVAIYEVHNAGWSYDLGYLLGVMFFFGGSGGAAKNSTRNG